AYARQLLKRFESSGLDQLVDRALQILQRLGRALVCSDAKLVSPLLIKQAGDLFQARRYLCVDCGSPKICMEQMPFHSLLGYPSSLALPVTSRSTGAMTRSPLTPRPEAFNLAYQPASVLGEIVLIA